MRNVPIKRLKKFKQRHLPMQPIQYTRLAQATRHQRVVVACLGKASQTIIIDSLLPYFCYLEYGKGPSLCSMIKNIKVPNIKNAKKYLKIKCVSNIFKSFSTGRMRNEKSTVRNEVCDAADNIFAIDSPVECEFPLRSNSGWTFQEEEDCRVLLQIMSFGIVLNASANKFDSKIIKILLYFEMHRKTF